MQMLEVQSDLCNFYVSTWFLHEIGDIVRICYKLSINTLIFLINCRYEEYLGRLIV